jgi:hypothetical protein
MSERNIVMKRWLRLTSLVLLTLVAAWLGASQTAKAAPVDSTRKKLHQITVIQGYSCAKDYTFFYTDGKLHRCTLSQETQYGEALIPRGSHIYLKPDGSLWSVALAHNTRFHDVLCKSRGFLNAQTGFYPSGKLKQCWLAGDQVVQGVPCRHEESILGVAYGIVVKHPNDPDIEFYESGKLESCTLAKDYGGKRRGDRFMQAP